ncbi:MAG: SPOR domain-containing protein [Alphaproteobacteria bacterium]|nr:SPOR domain-containing protein [Alphaproteobacteria bacterium]
MNDDRRYTRQNQQQGHDAQYGFDHYDLPAGRRNLGSMLMASVRHVKIRSPFFATAALLVTGAVFAGVIIASYPDSDDPSGNIPIVKADSGAYREAPSEPGGMDIPNRDTTIFSTMNDERLPEKAPVENLLADGPSAERLDAFARRVEDSSGAPSSTPLESSETPSSSSLKSADSNDSAPVEFKKIVAAETGEQGQSAAAAAIPDPVPPGETATAKPEIMHKPGESPETLEFVRSALDKGEQEAKTESTVEKADSVAKAESAAKVEPASGLAATAGSYYIQLGSVSSENGAVSEWGKIKKAHASELEGLSYRVQAANLGERGTFYRIQAGPVSKESAAQLCDSIKARKPGACLVTR